MDKLNSSMKIEIGLSSINNILHPKAERGQIKAIKMEFVSYLTKQLVFQKCSKLLSIAHDSSKEDKQILKFHKVI